MRPDETQPRTLADAPERLGREQRDVVAARPQGTTDPDKGVHIAARSDWREKKMRHWLRDVYCALHVLSGGSMPAHVIRTTCALLAAAALTALEPAVHAQTLVEYSSEARFQLDLHVPDAALTPFLPQGW